MDDLNKDKIINILKKQFPFLSEKYHLKKIGLFGSYAQNLNTEKSDVDLIVDFEKPIGLDFIELGDYLENLLDRKVDLITNEGLKNSKLNLNNDQIIYVN